MPEISFNARDVETLRKEHPEVAVQICKYWQIIREMLLVIKALPFVPQQVKDAIDWIIKFGDILCPKK